MTTMSFSFQVKAKKTPFQVSACLQARLGQSTSYVHLLTLWMALLTCL